MLRISTPSVSCAEPNLIRWILQRLLAILVVLSYASNASAQSDLSALPPSETLPNVDHLPSPWDTLKVSERRIPLNEPVLRVSWDQSVGDSSVFIDDDLPIADELAIGDMMAPRLPERREGFFQRASISGTWIAPTSNDKLGISELKLSSTFALPLPTREWPILVTPGFNVRYFDGPVAPDLPSRVYDAYVRFVWLPKLNDEWGFVISSNPGVYSDLEVSSSDAWRFPSLLMVRWIVNPAEVEFLLGVVYLDRPDIEFLPAVGAILNPAPDVSLELVFPRPRVSRRLAYDGTSEVWAYLAGELGGESWRVLRSSGAQDRVTALDVRLLAGLERRFGKGTSLSAEIGWVFARNLEYESATPDFQPADSLLLRVGASY